MKHNQLQSITIFITLLAVAGCSVYGQEVPTIRANAAPGTDALLVKTEGGRVLVVDTTTGTVMDEGADATSVIQNTIASGRRVVVADGRYVLSGALDLVSDFTLELSKGAVFEIPSGYEGYVLGFKGLIKNAHVSGGQLREASPAQRKWEAVRMRSSCRRCGVLFNTVRDTWIEDARIAVKLLIDGSEGWINGNEFQSLRIWHPQVFVDFDATVSDGLGFNRNHFVNIMGQGGRRTMFGARNIQGKGNVFIDVKFWDLFRNPNSVSASIDAEARDTLILGGIMTNRSFVDHGLRTQIIDQWQHASLSNLSTNSLRVVGKGNRNTASVAVEGSVRTSAVEAQEIILTNGEDQGIRWRISAGREGLRILDEKTGKSYRLILEEQN